MATEDAEDFILVGSLQELAWALEAGWDKRNVVEGFSSYVRNPRHFMQGLRWRSLHMTWRGMEYLANDTMLYQIVNSAQTLQNSIITMGIVKAPPLRSPLFVKVI